MDFSVTNKSSAGMTPDSGLVLAQAWLVCFEVALFNDQGVSAACQSQADQYTG